VQCEAVRCTVLQCLQCVAECCSVLQCVAVCCSPTYVSKMRVHIRMHRIHTYIYITHIHGVTAAYFKDKHIKNVIYWSIHIYISHV